MKSKTPHYHLRPDTAALDAAERGAQAAHAVTRGKIAELLAGWGPGEITTLLKAIDMLRAGSEELARNYRTLNLHPTPAWVVRQAEYHEDAAATYRHAKSVISRCMPRGDAQPPE